MTVNSTPRRAETAVSSAPFSRPGTQQGTFDLQQSSGGQFRQIVNEPNHDRADIEPTFARNVNWIRRLYLVRHRMSRELALACTLILNLGVIALIMIGLALLVLAI